MKTQLRQIRRLTLGLIVSSILNISLIAILVYIFIQERPPSPYFELKPAEKKERQHLLVIGQTSVEVIKNFKKMSLEQLKSKLTNHMIVENGLTQRDLALASLVAFHYFDLGKALLGDTSPIQKRIIPIGRDKNGKTVAIEVFPGLSERQFQLIVQFAHREKWPLSAHGLFLAMKKDRENSSLIDAFSLTSEFLAIEVLFNRSEIQIPKKELLNVLCEGNWKQILSFVQQQRIVQDLSVEKRQSFLLDYIKNHSKAAAYLLLKTDLAFAAKKLDDNHVIQILDLIDKKTPEAEQFALSLLTSPRSDIVWQMASKRLYEFADEPVPEKNHHHAAMARFVAKNSIIQNLTQSTGALVSEAKVSAKPPTQQASSPIQRTRLYIVQEGDSLWKIAKKFRVNIEALKAQNQLESDFLRPGTPLKIP